MSQRIPVNVRVSDLVVNVKTSNLRGGDVIPVSVKSIYGTAHEHYTGAYIVEPAWEEQVLPTKHKLMDNDVTIESIYIARVSNHAGGKTVYIGGVINDG